MNLPAGKQETPNQQQVTGRLAPTPSGYLHLGNAVNFVLTWLLVRQAGGTLHLRIDDLDRARLRRVYLDNIFEIIDWLKVDYDYGPTGPDDFLRHYSQLLHLPAYNQALRRLALPVGASPLGLLYGSPRSRTGGATALVPLTTPGVAWRARMPTDTSINWVDGGQGEVRVLLAAAMPDFVVRKKDGVVAYQLASVVDDLRLGTTLVVRGHDLLPSTAAQLWLASQVSDLKKFNQQSIQFFHHDLLTDGAGQKLSKSTQAAGETGILRHPAGPAVVYQAVARLLRLPPDAGESLATLQVALAELLIDNQ